MLLCHTVGLAVAHQGGGGHGHNQRRVGGKGHFFEYRTFHFSVRIVIFNEKS